MLMLMLMMLTMNRAGAEEKMNVELIVPIGAVVIAIFFWILIVFVIRSRKRVTVYHPTASPHS